MTNPQSPQGLPIAAMLAGEFTKEDAVPDEPEDTGALVGAADADAVRSGADADLTDVTRDSDAVPVGEDDLEADRRNSGA